MNVRYIAVWNYSSDFLNIRTIAVLCILFRFVRFTVIVQDFPSNMSGADGKQTYEGERELTLADLDFINRKESLKKLIDDDLLFDAMVTSRNVIIQQKITKGETLEDSHTFSTIKEISSTKDGVIEQFSGKFEAATWKIIKNVAQDVRDKHTAAMQKYKTKKREMKGLVDSCTEDVMWADFLVANNDAIMLNKRCEVLTALLLEIEGMWTNIIEWENAPITPADV